MVVQVPVLQLRALQPAIHASCCSVVGIWQRANWVSQVQVPDQAMQVVCVYPQDSGGFRVIASGFLHSGKDQAFLQLLDRHVVLRFLHSWCGIFFQNRLGKVFGPDHVRNGQHQGALDGIFKFTNVAGPVVIHEAGHGFRRNFLGFHFALDGKLGDKVFGQD